MSKLALRLCAVGLAAALLWPAAAGAVTGAIVYDASCQPDERDALDEAVFYGRLAVQTPAFEQCLAQRLPGYQPCSGDPVEVAQATGGLRLQRVLGLARNGNELDMACQGGVGGHASSSYIGFGHQQPEPVDWDADKLDRLLDVATFFGGTRRCTSPNDVACVPPSRNYHNMAATVWHEVIHTHGFRHWQQGGFTCGGAASYDFSLPQIVAGCVREVVFSSGFACGGDGAASCGPDAHEMITDFGSETCACVADTCLDGSEPVDTNGDDFGDACNWDALASASPTSLHFRYSALGTWVGPRTVTVSSAGADPVTFGVASLQGLDPANFEIAADGCSGTVQPPGQSCLVSVRFRAGSYGPNPRLRIGAYSAALSLPSNGGKVSVALSGEHFTADLPFEKIDPSYRFDFGG